jgi:archaellum component FlaF (FlaF/FlaG flagellin family)
MKTSIITIALFISFVANAFAQTSQKVTITLKNNGLVPRHFKFLEKRPGVPFNVFTEYLLPGQRYKVELNVGTSLSLVNQEEINASMRGLDVTGKPLLTIKADDEGRTVDLVADAKDKK